MGKITKETLQRLNNIVMDYEHAAYQRGQAAILLSTDAPEKKMNYDLAVARHDALREDYFKLYNAMRESVEP